MSDTRTARWRHRLFQLAMLGKGVDGLLEVVGGILILTLGPGGVSRTVALLTQHELAEDPNDPLAGFLLRHTHALGLGTIHFAAAYLLFHGLIKLWLVGGLLLERRWVFPVALVLMSLFVGFQLYRLQHHPSAGLAVLTVVDVLIIGLVWLEFRHGPLAAQPSVTTPLERRA